MTGHQASEVVWLLSLVVLVLAARFWQGMADLNRHNEALRERATNTALITWLAACAWGVAGGILIAVGVTI